MLCTVVSKTFHYEKQDSVGDLFESDLGPTPRRHAPMPEAKGGGREEQPHVQGAVAAWVQEGLEELSHIEGQEGWQ